MSSSFSTSFLGKQRAAAAAVSAAALVLLAATAYRLEREGGLAAAVSTKPRRRPMVAPPPWTDGAGDDELKAILVWDGLYGSKERVMGKGREPFYKLGCAETRCRKVFFIFASLPAQQPQVMVFVFPARCYVTGNR